ncbi:MAG: Uma2 family endonuclease [Deltaproteobacteria bacterium]|nr:Uma2 family endonuclease [Deltaproteobacteria bacterium]
MPEGAKKPATYDDLFSLPENMTGQIIDGELIATPRPSRRHARATSALNSELGPPYDFGRGGPGGWILLVEPEVALGTNLVVPDLAGWRKERLAEPEEHNWISVAPDWVCEVLSPGTVRLDRIRKMALYAEHGVPHLWLVDPIETTLEVFRLEGGAWVLRGAYGGEERVRAEPFPEAEIELTHLWWESRET